LSIIKLETEHYFLVGLKCDRVKGQPGNKEDAVAFGTFQRFVKSNGGNSE